MKRSAIGLLLVMLIMTGVGCQLFSNVVYLIKGSDIPAKYEGLSNSKVAIVVVSDASSYGPDSLTASISRLLTVQLGQNVKDISIVPQNVVNNWQDTNGWDQIDFYELGQGVDADKVMVIEVGSYSIHEGATLYKGRSLISTNVYDISDNGNVVFSQGPAEYVFPRSHARPAISTSEQQFESAYLVKLTGDISRNFYAYDKTLVVADDATSFDFDY